MDERARLLALTYRVQHRHTDSSWGEMAEVPSPPHDAAAHDPERGWGRFRLFRCTACDEEVIVGSPDALPRG